MNNWKKIAVSLSLIGATLGIAPFVNPAPAAADTCVPGHFGPGRVWIPRHCYYDFYNAGADWRWDHPYYNDDRNWFPARWVVRNGVRILVNHLVDNN